MPNVWVVGANISLHAVVPAFNMIVGTWKALFFSVVYTPHVMCEGWWTAAAIALLSTDVGVLKIVSYRLGFVRHRVNVQIQTSNNKSSKCHNIYLFILYLP